MAGFISGLTSNRQQIILGCFLVFNILISAVSRGGIILLGNVAYGVSILAILALTIYDLIIRKKEQASIERILMLMFFALFLMSFVFSLNKGYGLSELLLFGNGAVLFLYLSGTEQLKEGHINNLLKVILLGVAATIVAGIYIYIQYPLDRFASFFYNFEDKYIGYPNALADLLLVALPIATYFSYKKNKQYSICVALIILALYLTYSRGAYLSAFVEIAAGIILLYKEILKQIKKHRSILNIVAIAATVVVSSLVINSLRNTQYPLIDVTDKITLNTDEKASSVNERLEFYKGSIQIIKDHPWTGVGSDGFQFVYPQYQEAPFTTSNHPHNLFLKIGVENGLPTAITLLLFFLFVLAKSARSKSALIKIIGVSILGLLIHNQIDYNLNFVPNILLLFLLSGIVINQSNRTEVRIPTTKALIIVLSTFFILLSLNEGYYNYHFQAGRKALETQNYETAEKELSTSKKLIFPRRLYSSLGETYLKESKINEGLEAYQEAININTLDAHAYNSLGEVLEKVGLTEYANANFKLAKLYDGQNFLRFHYNYLATEKEIDKQTAEVYLQRLKRFTGVLANNEHNIILTDNPEYAMKIANLIYEKTGNEEFKNLQIKIEELEKREKEKFQQKFGFRFKTNKED